MLCSSLTSVIKYRKLDVCRYENQQVTPHVVYFLIHCVAGPDFTFDVLTIHNEREVSLDGKILRNRKTGKPSSSGTAEKQFQNYKGIVGNFPFKELGKYYYEVDVSFTIYQPLEQTWLVYELGICRKDIIDTHHTVERHEHARSCYVARYPEDGKLAHEFWHNRDLLTYVPLSDNTAGITVDLTYGLLVDTRRRKWTIADVGKQKKLHTFTGIDFTEALYPVFGTYNPDLVSVEMTLRTGSEISAFPPFLKGFQITLDLHYDMTSLLDVKQLDMIKPCSTGLLARKFAQ